MLPLPLFDGCHFSIRHAFDCRHFATISIIYAMRHDYLLLLFGARHKSRMRMLMSSTLRRAMFAAQRYERDMPCFAARDGSECACLMLCRLSLPHHSRRDARYAVTREMRARRRCC